MSRKKYLILLIISFNFTLYGGTLGFIESEKPVDTSFLVDAQSDILSSFNSMPFDENIYIENIIAEVSQNTSLIHHSVISNDRNPLGIDLNEPAFTDCSFYFSFTNEHPIPFSPSPFSYDKKFPSMSNYGCVGFLFYESDLTLDQILPLKNRAVQLFESRFHLNLIEPSMIAGDDQYYFPLYGRFSNLSSIILNSIAFLPQDGYFGSECANLLTNSSYLNSQFAHESVYYFDHLESRANIATFWSKHSNALCFDMDTSLNRLPLISLLKELEEESQFNSLKVNMPTDLVSLETDANLIDLPNSPLFIMEISYTGLPEGISLHEGDFIFDLSTALGISDKSPITLSSACFNSFLGLFSGISLRCYSSDLISIHPQEFDISQEKIVPLQHMLFLASNGTDDFSEYGDYQWKILFEDQGHSSLLSSFPSKVRNLELSLEDFIDIASPYNLPFIPCLLFDPPAELSITYHPQIDPIIIDLQKTVLPLNGSGEEFIVNQSVDVSLTVTNRGNAAIWGIPLPNLAPIGLNNIPPENSISDRLIVLGYDVDGMFSNATPRYFPVDLSGEGYFSAYSPDLLNESVRYRYSPSFTQVILDNFADLGDHTSYNESQLIDYAANFNDSASMFNPSNWVLQPNQSLHFSMQTILVSTNSSSSYLQHNRARIRIGSEHPLEYTDFFSNSVGLRLNSSSSLTALARIDRNFSFCGESNRYVLTLLPDGNTTLTNLTLKIPALGVLLESGDFSYEDGFLLRTLPHFNSTSLQKEFSFEFATPNSMMVRSGEISWDEDAEKSVVFSNEINLIAEFFYTDAIHAPHLPQLELQHSIEIMDDELLLMNCSVYNSGVAEVSKIHLLPLYSSEEFYLSNVSGPSVIENLDPSKTKWTQFTFEILMPQAILTPLIWINGSDARLYTFDLDPAVAIGNPNVSITKELHREVGWAGQSLQITIILTNTGDVPISNILIDDFNGFPSSSFALRSGTLQKTLPLLEVGESYRLNYSVQINQAGVFQFGKAQVKYLSIAPMVGESEVVTFRARSSLYLVLTCIFTGILVTCSVVFVFWNKRKGGQQPL